MAGKYTINVVEPSQQEVLEHVVRANERGQELVINGHHVYPHQVEVIADLVCAIWPEWLQAIVWEEFDRRENEPNA